VQDANRKTRALALLGSAIFLVVAPGTIAGLIPWWIGRWQVRAAFPGFVMARVVGAMLVIFGVVVVLECFARFAIQGLGTPAPIAPPRHLVVTGSYRFVRNPMYVAVLSLVFGQALWFGDTRIFAEGLLFWLATHLFVMLYEEPTLLRSFGNEYRAFAAHVPRWLPRLTPWNGD
jgi:protein-S-isoprenylcysteine O-methyltransferase Ste14